MDIEFIKTSYIYRYITVYKDGGRYVVMFTPKSQTDLKRGRLSLKFPGDVSEAAKRQAMNYRTSWLWRLIRAMVSTIEGYEQEK
jgi:hypothetical protein